MHEGLVTALWWLAFGGTHVGLTVGALRRRLVAAVGETGFVVLYSFVAIGTFAGLLRHVALHRYDGLRPALLPTLPPVQGALLALSFFGFSLFVAAVLLYPRAPMAVFRHRVIPVRGIHQVTRHPFFSGIALWAGAHAFLSMSPVTIVFFLGAVVFSLVGARHQDRRLVAELGEPYRSYVASTSFWPFVAAFTKRQKLRWAEQPWLAYAFGALASIAVYQVHDHLLDRAGAYVIGVVSLGSIVAILGSKLRASKARTRV